MANGDFEGVERLKSKLYSRKTIGMRGVKEHELLPKEVSVSEEWSESPISEAVKAKKQNWLKYFLGGSALFFTIALAYAFFLFSGGSNVISSQNIEIGIAGPISIRGGETLELDLTIRNKNSTLLELGDLIVEFPDGTRSPGTPGGALPRLREGVGNIDPGGEARKKISAVLFGEEKTKQTIKITFEYRVPGSNAIFFKETSYDVIISSSPLSLVVDGPVEANSGQEIIYKINVSSNAPEIVEDVLFRVDYPSGFVFKSADPKPTGTTNVWRLGDFAGGAKKTITIRGILSGEDGDIRVFRFAAGASEDETTGDISSAFAVSQKEVSLKRSFLGLSLGINGEQTDTVSVRSGRPIRVDISYANNLSTSLSNVRIALKLQGEALDRSSVSPERGFYQSQNDTVVWDQTSVPELASIPPGKTGVLSLSFASRSLTQNITALQNPEISLSLSASGARSDSSGVPENLVSAVQKKVQIQSDVQLIAKILYGAGPFTNTGGIPPKAEKETTYTVTWSLANGSNDITDAVVKATLPSYVRFVGTISPSGENVTFSNVGGVVTWRAGEVRAGVGFTSPPKEVSFQISFIPSISQIGSAPTLVNESVLTAEDRFTGSKINVTRADLSTRLYDDPTYKSTDDQVAP